MTGRESLKRAHTLLLALGFAGAVVGVAILMAIAAYEMNSRRNGGGSMAGVVTVVGMIAGVGIMLGGCYPGIRMMRCPWCRSSLHGMVQYQGLDKVKCCPFCARMLDDEVFDFDMPPSSPSKRLPNKPRAKKPMSDDEIA